MIIKSGFFCANGKFEFYFNGIRIYGYGSITAEISYILSMKQLWPFIFLLLNLQLYAQTPLKLKIDNPEPRMDEGTEISFDFTFFADEVARQLGETVILTGESSLLTRPEKNFTRIVKFTKAGIQTLGPLTFEINGQSYVTSTAQVDVLPPLPFEEGIWLRVVEHEGKRYLYVEQMIAGMAESGPTGKEMSNATNDFGDGNTIFAEPEPSPAEGLRFKFRGAGSRAKYDTESGSSQGFTYSFRKYEIQIRREFKGKFTLTKKHMLNMPKRVKMEEIEIRK